MKKVISVALMTVFVMAITGCGVKGPLYFPKDEPVQIQK